jgi:hypothetical protein
MHVRLFDELEGQDGDQHAAAESHHGGDDAVGQRREVPDGCAQDQRRPRDQLPEPRL